MPIVGITADEDYLISATRSFSLVVYQTRIFIYCINILQVRCPQLRDDRYFFGNLIEFNKFV